MEGPRLALNGTCFKTRERSIQTRRVSEWLHSTAKTHSLAGVGFVFLELNDAKVSAIGLATADHSGTHYCSSKILSIRRSGSAAPHNN